MSWRYQHCGFSGLAANGATFGPYAAIGVAAASTAMTILGSARQSAAEQQAGQIAYENALLRRDAAYQQAAQLDQAAGQQVAAGQRDQIEQIRRGQVMAGRLRAVMAASGAGVDENMIASMEGTGNYAGDVAAYDANEKARGLTNQATMARYSGDAGLVGGGGALAAGESAATSTLIGGLGKGAISFAEKYAGGSFGGGGGPASGDPNGIDSEIASWSQYGGGSLA